MGSGTQLSRPGDLAEAQQVMARAHREGLRVLPRGAGTAQSWGAPVRDVDLVVDTTGLDQVLAYNPADMTVAVGAGTRLRDLQARLAGQWIALDAARVEAGATVGGLLTTGDGGPRRATYGTLRDLVIGITVVLADGTVARSGGHVIKNVAGYDLAKLFCGSLGSLGLVTEVVLRVHPRPEASRTVTARVPADEAYGTATELLRTPLEPAALEWYDGRLLARFEGSTAGVDHRTGRALDLLGDRATSLAGDTEQAVWDAVAANTLGEDGDTVLRAGTRPSLFPELATLLAAAADRFGLQADLASSIGIGVHTVRIRGGDPAGHAALVEDWRAEVGVRGGAVTLHRRMPGVDELAASWGPPPSSLPVLRAVKSSLDPDGRLAPGRFAPWW